MVKIPALELDGQNWKFYRAKYLEAAATYYCLDVLGGRPDDGTDDWEEGNALLCSLFMETIPASIYYRIRLNTAHENYKYLAKCFRDNDPIEVLCAKKFAARTNEAKRDPSAGTPTSENAATGAEWEDPPTKDLTRGTKDVDDRNVGREDPRMSPEASAKGTSAECANGTLVLLESAPHETQNVPRNSLPLTLRLPIDGKPGECKQEAANGVVTAGCTKGMVGTANLPETDADVDRTALLGGEPAERVCGVDEGDETDREYQSRIQQTNRKKHQRNANANMDVPSAHKLPLEGEWTVYASGEDQNLRADRPSESKEAEDTAGVQSEGCEGGTSWRAGVDEPETVVECCQQLRMADGSGDREVEPEDTPNESETLVTVSIASESPDGGGIPRVHLGGTRSRTGDANGCGNRVDASSCQADASRGSTGVLDTSYSAAMAGMSDGEGAGTYLGIGDAKRVVHATDGIGSQTDASSGHWDVQSVETEAITPANATQIISIPRKKPKPPDSPAGAAKQCSEEPNGHGSHADTSSARTHASCVGNDAKTAANATETVKTSRNEQKLLNSPSGTAKRTPDVPNGSGSHADASSVHTDTHCVGNATETAENATKNVRTRTKESETRNSPNGIEIATVKLPSRWKRVSAGDGDVYVPWNAPIEALDTANRRLAFGEVESGVEAIAPSAKGERAGDGDGDGGRNGDVGDVDGTTSGGDADSMRVEAVLLAGESQRVRYSRRRRIENLPVSSRPPIQRERRPYGAIRRRRRRGRLKIERINVSQTKQRETTHLGRAHAMQPPGNAPNRAYEVYRPRRRRGRIKIEPRNVNRALEVEKTYLGRANALRSTWRPKKLIREVNKLTFEYRMLGEPRRRNDGDYG